MAEPFPHPVGRTHLDLDGIERIRNEWGFNSFTTAEGAKRSALAIRAPAEWFIWRLADGSYDYTAVSNPEAAWFPAELVERIEGWRHA